MRRNASFIASACVLVLAFWALIVVLGLLAQ